MSPHLHIRHIGYVYHYPGEVPPFLSFKYKVMIVNLFCDHKDQYAKGYISQ